MAGRRSGCRTDLGELERIVMEASKCPKCGEEPSYLEHIEKWYCYECNSYLDGDIEESAEDGESHEEDASPAAEAKAEAPTCEVCGAEMELADDGEMTCAVCAKGTSDEKPKNEAQSLLDEMVAEVAQIPVPSPSPKPEPAAERPTVAEVTKTAVAVRACPICGKPLRYIEKYQRHYCYGCKKYAPKDRVKAAVSQAAESERKTCPDCGKELRFIEKYKEHYCYACKKYPFVKKKSKAPAKDEPPKCPGCGKDLKYIEKYQRHYCYGCKKYAPKGAAGTASKQATDQKVCPICKGHMKFVSEYNEWYCYKCKKYSLRPNKPVLLF